MAIVHEAWELNIRMMGDTARNPWGSMRTMHCGSEAGWRVESLSGAWATGERSWKVPLLDSQQSQVTQVVRKHYQYIFVSPPNGRSASHSGATCDNPAGADQVENLLFACQNVQWSPRMLLE
jgi:hypothetical protein